MSSGRSRLLLGLATVVLTAACGGKRVAPAPPAPAPSIPTLVVLLPDPETRVTGRAIVFNEFGSTNLAAPRAASRATATAAPGAVMTITRRRRATSRCSSNSSPMR